MSFSVLSLKQLLESFLHIWLGSCKNLQGKLQGTQCNHFLKCMNQEQLYHKTTHRPKTGLPLLHWQRPAHPSFIGLMSSWDVNSAKKTNNKSLHSDRWETLVQAGINTQAPFSKSDTVDSTKVWMGTGYINQKIRHAVSAYLQCAYCVSCLL